MRPHKAAAHRYLGFVALVTIASCSDLGPRLDYENFGGCGNVFVYATTADRREALVVRADRQQVTISGRDTTFDLANPPAGLNAHLELFSRAPTLGPYCSDAIDGSAPPPTVWNAVAGQVSIQIDTTQTVSANLYGVIVRIQGATFQGPDGQRVAQRMPVVIKATVGWLAG